MEPKKQCSQEQKFVILVSAEEIGIKEAMKLTEMHYTTVYEWRIQLNGKVINTTIKLVVC